MNLWNMVILGIAEYRTVACIGLREDISKGVEGVCPENFADCPIFPFYHDSTQDGWGGAKWHYKLKQERTIKAEAWLVPCCVC